MIHSRQLTKKEVEAAKICLLFQLYFERIGLLLDVLYQTYSNKRRIITDSSQLFPIRHSLSDSSALAEDEIQRADAPTETKFIFLAALPALMPYLSTGLTWLGGQAVRMAAEYAVETVVESVIDKVVGGSDSNQHTEQGPQPEPEPKVQPEQQIPPELMMLFLKQMKKRRSPKTPVQKLNPPPISSKPGSQAPTYLQPTIQQPYSQQSLQWQYFQPQVRQLYQQNPAQTVIAQPLVQQPYKQYSAPGSYTQPPVQQPYQQYPVQSANVQYQVQLPKIHGQWQNSQNYVQQLYPQYPTNYGQTQSYNVQPSQWQNPPRAYSPYRTMTKMNKKNDRPLLTRSISHNTSLNGVYSLESYYEDVYKSINDINNCLDDILKKL